MARWKVPHSAAAERSSEVAAAAAVAARTGRNAHASNSTKVGRIEVAEAEPDRWKSSTSWTRRSAAFAEPGEERSRSTEQLDCAASAERPVLEAAGDHDNRPEVARIELDTATSSPDETEAATVGRAGLRDNQGIAVVDKPGHSGEAEAVDNASRMPEQSRQKTWHKEVQIQLAQWRVDDSAEREAGPELREEAEMDSSRKTEEVGREQGEWMQRSGRVSRPRSWHHRYWEWNLLRYRPWLAWDLCPCSDPLPWTCCLGQERWQK